MKPKVKFSGSDIKSRACLITELFWLISALIFWSAFLWHFPSSQIWNSSLSIFARFLMQRLFATLSAGLGRFPRDLGSTQYLRLFCRQAFEQVDQDSHSVQKAMFLPFWCLGAFDDINSGVVRVGSGFEWVTGKSVTGGIPVSAKKFP